MAIKSDHWIRQMAREDQLIEPFVDHQVTEHSCISYGLGSYSYDMRLAPDFRVCRHVGIDTVIDPKDADTFAYAFNHVSGPYCIVPANGFVLARSIETFRLPYNVLGMFFGKSTYMRCGLSLDAGLVQPGFKGQVVIELKNATPFPIRVYAYEGIAQIVFHECEPCAVSYTGQYYGQTGIRLPNS